MHHLKGGVRLLEFKDTSNQPIERMPLAKKSIILLAQNAGSPSKPIVKVGDLVKRGELIAEPSGFISANIHAPVSGKIIAIEAYLHPAGSYCESIVIESDDQDESVALQPHDPEKLSPAEIIEIIKSAGIVGLGGAAFPTHIKLAPPKERKIDTVIFNGCECEPYLTCDHRVMFEESEKVVRGLKLLMKVLNVESGYITVEANKKDLIEKFIPLIKPLKNVKIIKLPTKYPQGAEKQLIAAVLKREVPSGKLPMDVGCIVNNVQTGKVIYDAVYKGQPLYERVVTVAGNVKRPGNLMVRIGTPVSELIDYCGGFIGNPKKIIIGGPMMGITQSTLDAPVMKGTSGIVVLTEKETKSYEPSNCIRCGKCIEACSMKLVPTMISRLVEKEQYDSLESFSPLDCIECGCCAYVCPAKIQLIQNLKLAKLAIRKRKNQY